MLKSNKENNLESGLSHWLYQKVTALLLIPITVWVLLKLPKFMQLSFSEKLSWINASLNLYLVAFFFIISAFHFKLGLTVIIEDYIHNSIVKKYLLTIIRVIALLIASFSLGLCVYKNLGG
tara:strand:- start:234 stop:596 length:363 start_codon:yes stop_codon:yes gene_type:complete